MSSINFDFKELYSVDVFICAGANDLSKSLDGFLNFDSSVFLEKRFENLSKVLSHPLVLKLNVFPLSPRKRCTTNLVCKDSNYGRQVWIDRVEKDTSTDTTIADGPG